MMPNIIPVLALPIIQSVLLDPTSVVGVLMGYGTTPIIIVLFLTAVFLEYRSIGYRESPKRLRASKGFFYLRSSDIPYQSIQSVYIKKNLRPRIFGARQFFIYTAGSFLKKGSYSLFLNRKNEKQLVSTIFGNSEPLIRYKGGVLRTVIMVMAHSNTLTGLIIIAPMLYRISTQTDQMLKQSFDSTVSLLEFGFALILPEAIADTAALLIGGWAIAFIVQLFRYAFFRLEIGEKYIKTSRGIFNRVDYLMPISKINAIQIRQSILMQLMNLRSTYVNAVGVKAQKGDLGMLIPADTEKNTNAVLDRITDMPKSDGIKVKPVRSEFMSFLWLPAFSVLGDLGAMLALHLLGYFGEVVRFILIVLLVVLVYWVLFRITAYFKSSLTICDKAVRIDYFERLNFTRTFIPYERIQFLNVYRSPVGKIYNTANLKVYVYSNKYTSYRIKNLRYDTLMEAVKIIEERI